jgi:hypothetical protein
MAEKTIKGNDLQRGERLQIMLDEDELRALDDFRYQNRMPSRAAAVRELLRRGLAAIGHPDFSANAGSSTFGVINSPRPDGDGSGK